MSDDLVALHSSGENFMCFECRRNPSKWACVELGTFLCIDCAHAVKTSCSDLTSVKSLSMATWSSDEIIKLKLGGNQRLRLLFVEYGVPINLGFTQKYSSGIVAYYKELLNSETFRLPLPIPPRVDQGIYIEEPPAASWWSRTADLLKSRISSLDMSSIKDRSRAAICGLQELTCFTAPEFSSSQPNENSISYIRMPS